MEEPSHLEFIAFGTANTEEWKDLQLYKYGRAQSFGIYSLWDCQEYWEMKGSTSKEALGQVGFIASGRTMKTEKWKNLHKQRMA